MHETADGELAVLHDLGSLLAASQDAEINAPAMQAIHSVVDLRHATVHVGSSLSCGIDGIRWRPGGKCSDLK